MREGGKKDEEDAKRQLQNQKVRVPLLVTVKDEPQSQIQVWNINTGKLIHTMQKKTDGSSHKVSKLIKTNDNKLVTIGNDKLVNLYY